MGKKNKQSVSFDSFYEDIFQSRWPQIRDALSRESLYHELQFHGSDGSIDSYFLDEASYETALLLAPEEGDLVLDMCAAPGGKSLSLLSAFPAIRLISNEWSGVRRDRLRRVVQQHLPESLKDRIEITGHDARTWFRHEQNIYDRILLDVPCSSEKHVMNSPRHLKQWSPKRSKHLAIQAFTMLASALEVVKIGGSILYSTCALSPYENDEVIEKLHKKRFGRFEILPIHLPFGEKTRYGWQVIPDTAGGRGPMYAASIRRLS